MIVTAATDVGECVGECFNWKFECIPHLRALTCPSRQQATCPRPRRQLRAAHVS